MITKTKDEHLTGSLASTVRQALFIICNFKKRHTSKKQMTEAKKISRRELIKQGGDLLYQF